MEPPVLSSPAGAPPATPSGRGTNDRTDWPAAGTPAPATIGGAASRGPATDPFGQPPQAWPIDSQGSAAASPWAAGGGAAAAPGNAGGERPIAKAPETPIAGQQSPLVTTQPPPAAAAPPDDRPWVPLILASLALVGSLSANLFLGWSYVDARHKYRTLVRKTADKFRRVAEAA
jgi:hypothetical protein